MKHRSALTRNSLTWLSVLGCTLTGPPIAVAQEIVTFEGVTAATHVGVEVYDPLLGTVTTHDFDDTGTDPSLALSGVISSSHSDSSSHGSASGKVSLSWNISENGSGYATIVAEADSSGSAYAWATGQFFARFRGDNDLVYHISQDGGPPGSGSGAGSASINYFNGATSAENGLKLYSVSWWFDESLIDFIGSLFKPAKPSCRGFIACELGDKDVCGGDDGACHPEDLLGAYLLALSASAEEEDLNPTDGLSSRLVAEGGPSRFAFERQSGYLNPVILPGTGFDGIGVDADFPMYFEAPAESIYAFSTDDNAPRFRSFAVPQALADGDTTFLVVADGERFFIGPNETIDFTAVNPEGVGTFYLGVDSTESIVSGTFPDYVLAMSFMSHGTAAFSAVPVESTYESDFDKDGDVDNDDLTVWQGDYAAAELAVYVNGDADGDGDADGRDFLIWQRQYGSGVPLTAGLSVPEPGSLVLVLAIAKFLLNRNKSHSF